jgi:hypothetical protein
MWEVISDGDRGNSGLVISVNRESLPFYFHFLEHEIPLRDIKTFTLTNCNLYCTHSVLYFLLILLDKTCIRHMNRISIHAFVHMKHYACH